MSTSCPTAPHLPAFWKFVGYDEPGMESGNRLATCDSNAKFKREECKHFSAVPPATLAQNVEASLAAGSPLIQVVREAEAGQQKGIARGYDTNMRSVWQRSSAHEIPLSRTAAREPVSSLSSSQRWEGWMVLRRHRLSQERAWGARSANAVARCTSGCSGSCHRERVALLTAHWYETLVEMEVHEGEHTICWQERRLIVQSIEGCLAVQVSVHERLEKAEKALGELMVRKQGTPRLTSRGQVDEQVQSMLSSLRVEGVLQISIQEEVQEQPVHTYRGKLSAPRQLWSFQIYVERGQQAIERAMKVLGWRVSATTQHAATLGLAQAVEASRDEDLVERTFGRLKGHLLSLGPLSVQRDDHSVGLIRLVIIALRVVTVLEGVALAEQHQEITGRCAGNPKRRTTQPTTERLLEAFHEIRLPIVSGPGFVQRHRPPLSALQQQIVALCGFSPAVSTRLTDDSSCRPLM